MASSKICLNEYFVGLNAELHAWTPDAIGERGREMAEAAAKLWRGPADLELENR